MQVIVLNRMFRVASLTKGYLNNYLKESGYLRKGNSGGENNQHKDLSVKRVSGWSRNWHSRN